MPEGLEIAEASDMPEGLEIAAETDAGIVMSRHAPGQKTRKLVRKHPKRGRIVLIMALAVILFAFLWETFYLSGRNGNDTQGGSIPADAFLKIQYELNTLDWVDQQFLPLNEYSRPGTQLTMVNGIVIHYIGNPNTTALQNRNYFAGLASSMETYASSNFIIDLDGSVVQCVPVDEVAYASNSRNYDTLSIELCHPDETGEFTKDTYESAVALTAWLCIKYGLKSEDLLRHYDITGKKCPLYFVNNEEAWETFKADVSEAIENGTKITP